MSSVWDKRRTKVTAALAIVLATYAVVAVYFAERPWYRGRPINFWFDGLNQQYRVLSGQSTISSRYPIPMSSWGSSNTWVNLENPQTLKEFEPFRQMGADAVPFLVEKLEHPSKPVDSRKQLRKWLPQKLKWLAPYPKPPSEQQLLALWILGEIGPAAHGTVSNVLRFANTPGLDYAAIDTLGKINSEPEVCVPALCKNLINESDAATEAASRSRTGTRNHTRPIILKLLRQFGPAAHDAAPLLIDELQSCEDRLRAMNRAALDGSVKNYGVPIEKANLLFTAEALCRIDPQHQRKAISYLAKILRGEEFLTRNVSMGTIDMSPGKLMNPGARARAARCLSEIGSPEALLVLKDVLKDDDANVAAAAREAVERGPKK